MAFFSKLKNWISSTYAKITVALYSTALVFMINLGVTLWISSTQTHFKNLGDIYTSSCSQMKTVSIVVHLFINILSSLVLTSCNFCAQCLIAPTRTEVSRAHKAGDWLEIGTLSFRNLLGTRINKRRKVLAVGLFIGSLPLHLVWNSVFFSAIPISSYQVSLITKDFELDTKPWDDEYLSDSPYRVTQGADHTGARDSSSLQTMAKNSQLEHLDTRNCIKRYINADVRHKSVLLVASNISMSDRMSLVPKNNESSLLYRFPSITNAAEWVWEVNWLCSALRASTFYDTPPNPWCSEGYLLPHAEEWTILFLEIDADHDIRTRLYAKVDYCLSAGGEHEADGCAIRYSLVLLLAVTGLNALILICMYFTWKAYRARAKDIARGKWEKEQLLSLDEAVSSFLQHEDQYTTDSTFLEYSDYNNSIDFHTLGAVTNDRAARRLQSVPRLYFGPGVILWYIMAFFFAGLISIIAFLLHMGFQAQLDYGISTSLDSLVRMGIGKAHGYTIALTQVTKSLGSNAFYGTQFLANAPQVALGLFWWLANLLVTRMLLAQRWARFIVKCSGIRVSSPKGQQRSSYFLTLPYGYSLPLIVASALLHWLVSQAFFVVQTRGFVYELTSESKDQFIRDDTLDGSAVSYSLIACIFATVIALVIFLGIALIAARPLASRKLQVNEDGAGTEQGFLVTRMPLAMGCSAAISSACHPGPGSMETYLKPVKWGKMRSGKWSITHETPLRYSLDICDSSETHAPT